MQSNQKNRSGLRKVKQRGSEMIEFTLVLLPFLGFTFLILNIAYAVYQRSTIQHAVAQGVRYAVTSATSTGLGARSSIQKVVQSNAFGSMSSCGSPPTATTNPWCNISVDWYLVDQDTGALVSQDGTKGGKCMTKGNSRWSRCPCNPTQESSWCLLSKRPEWARSVQSQSAP